jgi:DNA-binding response OmpR family regulator
MMTKRRALWVDDDNEDRFLYEISILEDENIATDWAADASEAVSKLQSTVYNLIILDQVFPIGPDSSFKDVWSGCRLLYWLRGEAPPVEAHRGGGWPEFLDGKKPLLKNKSVPVIIISGFQDNQVDEALKNANHSVTIFPKPVDGEKLIEVVTRLLSN